MAAPVSTARQEWLDARRTYLGGTDVAALIGQNPWRTPYDVYAEKVLGERSEAGRKADMGVALEPVLRAWYEKDTGATITYLDEPIFHSEHRFLAANLDGLIEGVCVCEFKTYDFSTRENWGPAGTDNVPVHYWVQAQWYTGIAGLPYCILVALDRGTAEYTEYRIDHDPSTFDLLKRRAIKFWNENVVPQIPPELKPGDADRIIELYPASTGTLIESTPAQDSAALRLMEIQQTIKPLEKEARELKDALMLAIGENDGITTIAGTFKLQRVAAVDIPATTRKAYAKLALPRI